LGNLLCISRAGAALNELEYLNTKFARVLLDNFKRILTPPDLVLSPRTTDVALLVKGIRGKG
jgi:hypothetical protein